MQPVVAKQDDSQTWQSVTILTIDLTVAAYKLAAQQVVALQTDCCLTAWAKPRAFSGSRTSRLVGHAVPHVRYCHVVATVRLTAGHRAALPSTDKLRSLTIMSDMNRWPLADFSHTAPSVAHKRSLVLENRWLSGSGLTWLHAGRFCVMQGTGLFEQETAERTEITIHGFSVSSAPSCSKYDQRAQRH